MSDSLKIRFAEQWDPGFLRKNEDLIVGVSGGPDSVALLHLILHVRQTLDVGWAVHVAHLDHCLRGEQSDADAAFVEKLAGRLDLPFICEKVDVRGMAKTERRSLEDAARNARRIFFKNTAEKLGINKVFLAHNSDDQVETVLMRLLRGAGFKGLAGMTVRSSLAGDIHIFRPLLNVSRQEIEAFLKAENIPSRLDRSNADSVFTRNKVRNELLPHLAAEYNPKIKKSLSQLGVIASEAYEYIASQVEVFWGDVASAGDEGETVLDAGVLAALPKLLQRELVRRALEESGANVGDLTFEHVEEVLRLVRNSGQHKAIDIPGNIVVRHEYGHLFFHPREIPKEPDFSREAILEIPGEAVFEPGSGRSLSVSAEVLPYDKQVFEKFLKNKSAAAEMLDADVLGKKLVLRLAREGDRFRPFGMKGTKKVSDFFVDEKVPAKLRRYAVVAESAGKICWLMGYRVDQRFAVSDDTKKMVKLLLKTNLSLARK